MNRFIRLAILGQEITNLKCSKNTFIHKVLSRSII